MTFKTKYNTGGVLWFIADSKILNLPVKEIEVNYRPFYKNELSITYTFLERVEKYEMFPQWNKTLCYIKEENEVYKTKEELLKNL